MRAVKLTVRPQVQTVRPKIVSRQMRNVSANFFRFGKAGDDSKKAGIYGSQTRDEYTPEDVEQYFNYMGLLAVEGNYDRIDQYIKAGIHPADILLMWAVEEGDEPKIEELLGAGADINVRDPKGRSLDDLAKSDKSKRALAEFKAKARV